MSTPTPDSSDRGLSDRDRAALDAIAGHENAADPGFVARLGSGRPAPAGRSDGAAGAAGTAGGEDDPATDHATRRWNLGIQIAVVVVVAMVLLPSSWLAVVLLVALVVGPAVAAVVALRRHPSWNTPPRPAQPPPDQPHP